MGVARVISVNTGPERGVDWATQLDRSAIDKRPVAGAVRVEQLGLDCDEQADQDDHGGPEQAVYAYAREDLDWWAARLRRELRDGMFGENITTGGLDVTGAVIGETWRLGSAVVQVTSPRIPCVTFKNWMYEKGWVRRFREGGRPGAYLRVLQPGTVQAGSEVELLFRPAGGVTVAAAMEAFYERDAGVICRMLATPGHNRRWDGMIEELPTATAAQAAG